MLIIPQFLEWLRKENHKFEGGLSCIRSPSQTQNIGKEVCFLVAKCLLLAVENLVELVLEYSSVAESLPSAHEGQGLIFSTTKEKEIGGGGVGIRKQQNSQS